MADGFEVIVDPQLVLRTRLSRSWPAQVNEVMALSLQDIALQAGRRVVERTPRPGHLEPPGGRTWVRTGNAARSISPGLGGQTAENVRTAQRLINPYARVVSNRAIANYVVPWLETGKQKTHGGKHTVLYLEGGEEKTSKASATRIMHWPPGGYQMFKKTKADLAAIAQVVVNNVVKQVMRARV